MGSNTLNTLDDVRSISASYPFIRYVIERRNFYSPVVSSNIDILGRFQPCYPPGWQPIPIAEPVQNNSDMETAPIATHGVLSEDVQQEPPRPSSDVSSFSAAVEEAVQDETDIYSSLMPSTSRYIVSQSNASHCTTNASSDVGFTINEAEGRRASSEILIDRVVTMGYDRSIVERYFEIARSSGKPYLNAENLIKDLLAGVTSVTNPKAKKITTNTELEDLKARNKFLSGQVEHLTQQLDQLKNEGLCRLCCNAKRDTCLIPCGHMITCKNCAHRLQKCSICRRTIKDPPKISLGECSRYQIFL